MYAKGMCSIYNSTSPLSNAALYDIIFWILFSPHQKKHPRISARCAARFAAPVEALRRSGRLPPRCPGRRPRGDCDLGHGGPGTRGGRASWGSIGRVCERVWKGRWLPVFSLDWKKNMDPDPQIFPGKRLMWCCEEVRSYPSIKHSPVAGSRYKY